MEPVGSPIGSDIAAMTPYRADFHTSECLPDVLAAADVSIGYNDGAICVDDSGGKRRHLLIDASADPTKHGERKHQYDSKTNPQFFHEPFPFEPSHPRTFEPGVPGYFKIIGGG